MNFLGSASALLETVFEPVYDRLEEEFDDYDSDTSWQDDSEAQTLDEVGYRFSHRGTHLILDTITQDAAPVWKKKKSPIVVTVEEHVCGICLGHLEDAPLVVETPCCHSRYCRECMERYLHFASGDISNLHHVTSSTEVSDSGSLHLRVNRFFGVACPSTSCSSIIEGDEFQRLANPATWTRFEGYGLLMTLRKMASAREIRPCPNKCGGFMQNSYPRAYRCVCSTRECRERTAAEELRRQQKIERSRFFLLRNWAFTVGRLCPQCKTLIEKDGGCDHMHCTVCGSRWNWSEAPPY